MNLVFANYLLSILTETIEWFVVQYGSGDAANGWTRFRNETSLTLQTEDVLDVLSN